MAIAFDTLAAAQRMEDAGMDRKHAAAVAATAREAADSAASAAVADRDALATKADLAPLATKAEMAALEARMTWRIVGLVVAANGVLAAVLGGLLVAVLDRLP